MLTTLKRAKQLLRLPLDDKSQDAELTMLLEIASDAIETRCRRKFGSQSHTQEVEKNHGQNIMLRQYPVQTITSIQADGVAVTGYKLYKEKGMLSKKDWPSSLIVEYDAGYTLPTDDPDAPPSDLPKQIEYACILFVQYAQRNPGVKSERVGDISVTYGDDGDDLPAPIKALIAPFVSRCL